MTSAYYVTVQKAANDGHTQPGDVAFFTFEPHILKCGGKWGFKYKNIYFFDTPGAVTEL